MKVILMTFFVVLLTSRLFSETMHILPKTTDLVDLLVIPLLAIAAVGGQQLWSANRDLDQKILRISWILVFISLVSMVINADRTHWAPSAYYIFSLLEGPVLYLALNRLVRDKEKFGRQIAGFIYVMLLIEAAAVVFVNMPMFLSSHNPDYVSGTFGNNSYQFSVLLIVIGGFFLTKIRSAGKKMMIAGIAVQVAVFVTFILLQYRTATPAFFGSYLVLIALLYGKRIMRLGVIAAVLATIGYFMFSFVAESNFDLKYGDILSVFQDPEMVGDFGKVLAYSNTFKMFGDMPSTALVGCGPGTYVSRSANLFIVEADNARDKGVGGIIHDMFGRESFSTDVFQKYIKPLYGMEAVFGSVQANNPASSLLSVAAEIGLPAFFLFAFLYITMIVQSIRALRYAMQAGDSQLLSLSAALVVGVIYMSVISLLDSYLEMARVTLPIWLMFWTVTTLVRTHRRRQIEAIQEQVQSAGMLQQQFHPEMAV